MAGPKAILITGTALAATLAAPGSTIPASRASGMQDAGAARRHRVTHPHPPAGCATFCQQVGGLGAGGSGALAPVRIGAGPIRLDSGGVAPIRVSCLQAGAPCDGAVVIRRVRRFRNPAGRLQAGAGAKLGAGDLAVGPGLKSTVYVGISGPGARLARRRGRLRMMVIVALNDQAGSRRNRVLALVGR